MENGFVKTWECLSRAGLKKKSPVLRPNNYILEIDRSFGWWLAGVSAEVNVILGEVANFKFTEGNCKKDLDASIRGILSGANPKGPRFFRPVLKSIYRLNVNFWKESILAAIGVSQKRHNEAKLIVDGLTIAISQYEKACDIAMNWAAGDDERLGMISSWLTDYSILHSSLNQVLVAKKTVMLNQTVIISDFTVVLSLINLIQLKSSENKEGDWVKLSESVLNLKNFFD